MGRSLLMLRMASLGSMEDLLAAVSAGYLKNSDGSPSASSSSVPPEQLTKWKNTETRMYGEVARFCAERLQHWETTVGALVATLDHSTYAGGIAAKQYETDRRLLLRCGQFMLTRAAALADTDTLSPISV